MVKKVKVITICTSIVLAILLVLLFLDFLLLNLLGFQYDSPGALLFFLALYLFFEIPLSLIGNALPKALKSVGLTRTVKGWQVFTVNTVFTFILFRLLDIFMEGIKISVYGAIIFASVSGLLNLKFNKIEAEPPDIDSKEFQEIKKRLGL